MTTKLSRAIPSTIRYYSTPPPASSHPYLSRSQLNSAASTSSSSSSSPHIGPFPLPHSQLDRDYAISQQAKTWSKLNTPERIGVAAKQTSSFFVVIAGAGLCGLVVWAVGSELFSENSPTRIFEDCTERIKQDKEVTSMLIPPLAFHGASSSSDQRLRRNRRISHSLTTDPTTGLETLFIRFYVEGQDPSREGEEESWLDWAKINIGPLIWQDSHHPTNYNPKLSADTRREEEEEFELRRKQLEQDEKRRTSWKSWLGGFVGGAFGGVTRGVREAEGSSSGGGGLFKRARKPKLGEHYTGEVVAELQKDSQSNQFVYKQLFIAIPDTQTPNYYRHDISTDVITPAEGKGLDRLRVWQRNRTVVQ